MEILVLMPQFWGEMLRAFLTELFDNDLEARA
jgi:hypothetical protein